MIPVTKLSKIKDAMDADDWGLALKIAAGFPNLGEEREAITKASESIRYPDFYIKLGLDLNKVKEDGIEALKRLYPKTWEEVKKKKAGINDLNATE